MDLISLANVLNKRYKIGNWDGKSNYHTHTLYCDGGNTPEEMVEAAISLGFTSLGFSGHQYSPQDAHYAMDDQKEELYRKEIISLREKYREDINIYLGIERDYCCQCTEGFQYVIGSTHHVNVGEEWMNVDESPTVLQEGVNKLFGGDYMAFIEAYYHLESKVLEKTKG